MSVGCGLPQFAQGRNQQIPLSSYSQAARPDTAPIRPRSSCSTLHKHILKPDGYSQECATAPSCVAAATEEDPLAVATEGGPPGCRTRGTPCWGERAQGRLGLVAAGFPAAARLLELAALAAHIRLGMGVGDAGRAAVLDSLARVLGPAQQNAVGARGCQQRQLVKGQDLAASLRSKYK